VHIASPGKNHIEVRFGWRHGDSSCVCRGIEGQIGIFDVISQWKAICVLIVPHVSFFLISVTKLWEMKIHLCMCKGGTHHVKVVGSKSACETANTLDFCFAIPVKEGSKTYIIHQCYQGFQIGGLVLGASWKRTGTVARGFTPSQNRTPPNPRFFGRFPISANLELWLQFSIWVLILSQYDIYVTDAVLDALSPANL